MLGRGLVDPNQVALVSEPPASGFLGADNVPGAPATVRIATNEPEHVVVAVDTTVPGFLFLADQYAPGWEARVNGAPAEILRADYAFRLVQIPAGHSEVAFRYRPRPLYAGAALSLATAAALIVGGLVSARRRRAGERGIVP